MKILKKTHDCDMRVGHMFDMTRLLGMSVHAT